MGEIDFEERATQAIWSAVHMGSDAHQTTSIQQVEQNLDSHIDTELDVIWEDQGDKPGDEWERIKSEIIKRIPEALEEIQSETHLNFYDERVLEQFEELQ